MLVQCHLCSLLVQINHLNAHLKYLHKYKDLLRYKCAVATCGRFYSNRKSFGKHASSHLDYPTVQSAAQIHTQSLSTCIDLINFSPDAMKTSRSLVENLNSECHKKTSNRSSGIDSLSHHSEVSIFKTSKVNTTRSLVENLNFGSHREAYDRNSDLKLTSGLDLDTIDKISSAENSLVDNFVQSFDLESHIEPLNRHSDVELGLDFDTTGKIPSSINSPSNSLDQNASSGSHTEPPNRHSDFKVGLDLVIDTSCKIPFTNNTPSPSHAENVNAGRCTETPNGHSDLKLTLGLGLGTIEKVSSAENSLVDNFVQLFDLESHIEPLKCHSDVELGLDFHTTGKIPSSINSLSHSLDQNASSGSHTEPPNRHSDFKVGLDLVIDTSCKFPFTNNTPSPSHAENVNAGRCTETPNGHSDLKLTLGLGLGTIEKISSAESTLSDNFVQSFELRSHIEPPNRHSDFELGADLDTINKISSAENSPSDHHVKICDLRSHTESLNHHSDLLFNVNTTATIPSVKARASQSLVANSDLDDHPDRCYYNSEHAEFNYLKLLQRKALALTLNFSADFGLSRIQVQRIVQAFHNFINNDEVNEFKSRVLSLIDPENRQTAVDHFEKFQNLFRDLDSEHKRLVQLEADGYYIPPISNFIGTMEVSRPDRTMVTKEIYCQYIPVKSILKAYLGKIETFNKIYVYWCNLQQNDNKVSNIVQSEFWKRKISDNNKIVFPLFLYQDDFETGNPLGSRAGIHKLCGVYMTIGCLPPEYRSKLVNIFLILLCHAADVKNYDSNMIYGPLIEDLNDLESNGIVLEWNDTKLVVYFKLAVIIGDNLGLNSTLGFTESFSAKFSCRFCKTPKNLSRELCSEKRCVMRNKNNYDTDLSRNCLSETGIRQPCVWNRVVDFHAIENPCVDIMHDLLEGVCKLEMALLLKYAIVEKKYFTLAMLNERIKFFDRTVTSNAPPLISNDDLMQLRIKMTASEMKTFIMNAGIIFGDLIPNENDEHWKLYRLLRKILCSCLKQCVSDNIASRLEILIEEHHNLYVKLYGNTLKPKHHFLLHYARIMRQIGPLRHVWAMRFEAKHRPSKKNAAISFSRVNICKTLAIQHQLNFGNALMEEQFCKNIITYETLDDNVIEYHKKMSSLPSDFHRYKVLKKLTIEHITFKVNDVIVGSIEENPIFGLVQNVLIKSNDITSPEVSDFVFIVKLLKTVSYNEHYQAHKVVQTNTLNLWMLKPTDYVRKVSVVLMSDGNNYVVCD